MAGKDSIATELLKIGGHHKKWRILPLVIAGFSTFSGKNY
jgi:hypothetical protein